MCHAREFVLLLVSNLPTGGFRQESEVIEFFFFGSVMLVSFCTVNCAQESWWEGGQSGCHRMIAGERS